MSEAAVRPVEAILKPDLPVVDPHHHLWDRTPLLSPLPPLRHSFEHVIRRTPRYLLPDLLADTGSGHNVIATVYLECGAFCRADGPDEMKPVGEVESVNGVAAMAASGIYGKAKACAEIVGQRIARWAMGGARSKSGGENCPERP